MNINNLICFLYGIIMGIEIALIALFVRNESENKEKEKTNGSKNE